MSPRELRNVKNICQLHTSSLLGNYLTMSNKNKTTDHKIAKEVTSADGGG